MKTLKSLRITLIITSLIAIFMFSGLVSALDQNEIQISTVGLNQNLAPGTTTTVRVTLTSSSDEQLRIYRMGFHFDWMAENQFYTNDFTSNPITISSGGTHVFDPMVIQIPPTVSPGSHSYFVGIDGVEGYSSEGFSWDSPSQTIQVSFATQTTPTPPQGSGGQQGQGEESANLLLYIVIIAVVVGVALFLVLMVMRKKRKPAPVIPAAEPLTPSEPQPENQ